MIGRCWARTSSDATGKFSCRCVLPDRDGLTFVMAPLTHAPGNGSLSPALRHEPDGPGAIDIGNIEAPSKRRGPQSECADRDRSCFPPDGTAILVARRAPPRLKVHGAFDAHGIQKEHTPLEKQQQPPGTVPRIERALSSDPGPHAIDCGCGPADRSPDLRATAEQTASVSMSETSSRRPPAPKPEDYVVVAGSRGSRRDFRISVGLREGW